MKGLWTLASAIAVLALSVSSAAALSLRPGEPSAASQYFSFANDQMSVSGHVTAELPAPFTLDTSMFNSLADIRVTRDFAPGAAIEFANGNTGIVSPHALRAQGIYDGLFVSDAALSAPFASLADGGTYGGMRFTLGDVRLRFGVAVRDSLRVASTATLAPMPADLMASSGANMSAQTASASLDWQITDWAGIAVTATQASERGTLLGRPLADPLADSSVAETAALSVSARIGFGDGWVTTLAYDEGVTQLNIKPTWMVPGGTLYSQAYGIAFAKEGVFGDDALGFSVSRPLQSNGTVFNNFSPQPRLVPNLTGNGAQQSDIQLGYVTTFLDGSLALQANAGYQVNANGEQGRDAVTAQARAAIKF